MTWGDLHEELARWRGTGRTPDFWWRDDDATDLSAAVRRLLALSAQSGVPLALAVVPLQAEAELFQGLRCQVMLHGSDHRNRAGPGEKKTEFPAAESDAAALERLAAAGERLAHMAGDCYLRALAPPWNRFRQRLVGKLAGIGIYGLSCYGARSCANAAAGVRQVNTHVDIIDWRAHRGFVGDERALDDVVKHLAARRSGAADADEPTGLLTHHAVHDADCWNFLERLFEFTRERGLRWADPAQLFAAPR